MRSTTQTNILLEPTVIAGLTASLLLHVLLTLALLKDRPAILPPDSISVELEPFREEAPPQTPKEQIVSEQPKDTQTTEPPKTNLLSDEDHFVPKEQIQRGEGGKPSAPSVSRQKSDPQKPSAQQPEKTSAQSQEHKEAPQKKSLLLDRSTLEQEFTQQVKKSEEENSQTGSIARAAKPFSRPSGSGAAFLNSLGSNDYLPNLPDGDLTMLNTKASRFAVFVRRVAVQVFSQLRAQGWERLRSIDIASANSSTIVRAVMSPQGKLLAVRIEDSSGNPRFDDVVQDAVQSGARDPNPPVGALAADGNVHFIFESKSWVAMSPAPRSGSMTEQRWLFLGTGLE